MKTTRLVILLALASMVSACPTTADEPSPKKKALVELFTSQG